MKFMLDFKIINLENLEESLRNYRKEKRCSWVIRSL